MPEDVELSKSASGKINLEEGGASAPYTVSLKDTDSSNSAELNKEESNPVKVTIANDPQEAKTLLTGYKLVLLFIGLSLAMFLAALDQTIVATATPKITSELKAFNQFAWISTGYLLTSTALQPLYGKFSDIFGRKPIMIFAIVVFEIGSLLCGVAVDITMLIAARAIAGVGSAGIMSMVMIIISDVVNMRDRGKYQGILGAMFGLSSVVGPLLGGAFTDHVSWRWCFYINLPFGAIALVSVIFFMNIPHKSGNMKEKLLRVDYAGVATLVPAIVLLLLATSWGGSTYAWNSAIIIALYVVGGFIVVCFVLVELYVSKEPLLPMRLFVIRNFTLANIVSFMIGFCMLGTMIYLPIYFQIVKGDNATSSGLRMLPLMIALVLTSIVTGAVIGKTGKYIPFPIAGAAILTLGMGIITLLQRDSSFGQMVGVLIPAGVGLGLCLQTVMLVVQAAVPMPDIAVATTSITFFRSIGSVVGVAVFGALMNNQLASLGGGGSESINIDAIHNLPEPAQILIKDTFVKAIHLMFQTAIPFAGVGFFVGLGFKWIPLRKTIGGAPPPVME